MENITVNMENLTEEERKQLLALVKKGNKSKSKAWKPEYDKQYYSVQGNGNVESYTWDGCSYDIGCYDNLNCFRTKEEAEFSVEKRKVEAELKRFAEEHNEEEIDWNSETTKYYMAYDCYAHRIVTYSICTIKDNAVYFTSREIAEQAIKQIGEERLKKYYFEV